ncbi:ribosome maturation factor RimP [Planotetraspora thailandica]|uniref:Ribosome maturation factor RimP n=1 Tax=Planotetraspora thailandica TaxID=487172 RepID=A0A8J3XU83_9ACTN|nr:ribosome maturation factor RimP [Planotetraspora thailandica]GII55147.1 ribosome maturation factor RimP [Planotetraspora thailandica]
MGNGARRDQLVELLAPVVAADGFDLEDVTVTPAGKRSLVRVIVDRDGGVSLDDVAEVSLSISKELDAADTLGAGPYVLEVTSPGVDRPLTEPRHWRRATGRLVKADLKDGTSAEGRIGDVDDSGVVLDGTRRLGFDELVRGRVQIEFNRPDAGDEFGDGDTDDVDDEG